MSGSEEEHTQTMTKTTRTEPGSGGTRISEHPHIKQLIRSALVQEFDWTNAYVLKWQSQVEFRLLVKNMKLAGTELLVFRLGSPQTSEWQTWVMKEGARLKHHRLGIIWDREDYLDYKSGIYPDFSAYLVVVTEDKK